MVRSGLGLSKEKPGMNNLHRELAPISDAAWADIEEETTRTLKRYLAGRRVVDVHGPGGVGLSAVGTGHLKAIATPDDGILAKQREVMALVFRSSSIVNRLTTWSAVRTIPTGNRGEFMRIAAGDRR